MPLHDYRCTDCGKQFTLLIGVIAEPQEQVCPSCGSVGISRLISRFARLRSEDEIIDGLADPSRTGDLDDPKQLQSWMKHMGKETGEDFGDELDDAFDADESADEAVC